MKLSILTAITLTTLAVAKPFSVTYKEVKYQFDESEVPSLHSILNQEATINRVKHDDSPVRKAGDNHWLHGSGLPYLTGYLGAIVDFTNHVTEGSKTAHLQWLHLLHKMATNTKQVVDALKDEGEFDNTLAKGVVADFEPFDYINNEFFEAVLKKKSLYRDGSYSKGQVDKELKMLDEWVRKHLSALVRLTSKSDSASAIEENVERYEKALNKFESAWGY